MLARHKIIFATVSVNLKASLYTSKSVYDIFNMSATFPVGNNKRRKFLTFNLAEEIYYVYFYQLQHKVQKGMELLQFM